MIQAIIFDLDGVLVQTEGIHMAAVQKTFADFGYALSNSEVHSVIGRHPSDYMPELFAVHGISLERIAEFTEANGNNYDHLWDEGVTLIPGAEEVVQQLSAKGLVLNLASNSGSDIVSKFLERFGFTKFFSAVTTGEEVKKKKPDPEIYNLAKGKTGVPEDAILVIEDSGPGVTAAKAAGSHVAAVANEYTKDQDFSAADYHIETLEGIFGILE